MKTNAQYQTDFAGITEMVEQARSTEVLDLSTLSSRRPKEYRWDLGVGFEGAVQLALTGWPEGVAKIKAVRDKVELILRPKTHKQDLEYRCDGGSYIDVGRLCGGEPECFGNYIPPENPQKPITVAVNLAPSGCVSARALLNRGAAIAALVDMLESRGFSIELIGMDTVQGYTTSVVVYTSTVVIKDHGQPLDLDRIAFCLVHPAFARRIQFAVDESEPPSIRRAFGFFEEGGYGVPCSVRTDADVYIPAATSDAYFATDESSAQWVRNTLQASSFSFEEENGK